MSDTQQTPVPTSLSADGLPNICSIPPGVAFLPTLVEAIFSGQLIPGFQPADDPLKLADLTIWVPTRRAARVLVGEFVSRLDGQATLLPQIRALGGVNADDSPWESGDSDDLFGLLPVIPPVQRHLILSRLVLGWTQSLNQQQRELYLDNQIFMPSSLADAIRFAADLGQLMDTVATEEVEWSALHRVVPEDHADWWGLTLQFLKIASEQWPLILEDLQLQDGAVQRAAMLRRQAELYRRGEVNNPVIAAGSTGSIPATADLLKAIAHMPNGAVVLPALDRDLDNETWEKIDLADNAANDDGTAPAHPQYGLKRLLGQMGSGRSLQDIVHLGDQSDTALRLRELLVSEALRPAHATGHWQDLKSRLTPDQAADALAGVSLIEAPGERQEAMAIALVLRETLNLANATAALVTPDRNLARRVANELQRFGIHVDDSSGQPLRNTPPATFARLVLQVAFRPNAPSTGEALAGLLKHPLLVLGKQPAKIRKAARLFEIAVLRRGEPLPPFGRLANHVTRLREKIDAAELRAHRIVRRFSDDDWQAVFDLAKALDEVFANPTFDPEGQQDISDLTQQTISMLEACGVEENGDFNHLYGTESGRALGDFLGALLDHGSLLAASADQWSDVFDALMGERVVRVPYQSHPRIAILGPLEARLQSFDRVVLGGLNEKSWPATSKNDAFLSRPMKNTLGLPPPERRTGLAAHDFQVLMGTRDVFLSRSLKADNAPTIASRWLQRLIIVAGDSRSAAMRQRGDQYVRWGLQIDADGAAAQPFKQPRPAPPVKLRPQGLPITDIETWIADPYAIYAKRILKLAPLEPLQRQPDARERGTLFHAIAEDLVSKIADPQAEEALPQLLKHARQRFDAAALPAEIDVVWWQRFTGIAENLLAWHRDQMPLARSVHVELNGRIDVDDTGFALNGRVDRIDVLEDQSLAIFDYKTGVNPNRSAIISLSAPQLPLEAAMAQRGAFGTHLALQTSQLAYVRLRSSDALDIDAVGDGSRRNDPPAAELGEAAWARLKDLIAAYQASDKDYRSKARRGAHLDRQGDYDHLARVREWSVADDEGEE